jgi:NADH dehydrogenase/NADH:ubiquinone oxidoreductase subunit G
MSVDSEPGNMIDVAGRRFDQQAFPYSARTWELSRRKVNQPARRPGQTSLFRSKIWSVRGRTLESRDVSECWIADCDRFSYERCSDGQASPMLKQGGQWKKNVDWQTALDTLPMV